jgi:U2-associated protein SR140
MWPRTAEARARERHTGFVCFMHRQDAEDAIASCNDADVFHVGRRLVMRWGKNVKKITKSGAGGMPISPIQQKSTETVGATQINQRQPSFDQERDGSSAIRVTVPQSKERAGFISTVASYVAKDGAAFEEMLLREHAEDPLYTFLVLPSDPTSERKEEYIYYRWRVYGFAQGDGLFVWRAEPFVMLHPNGCFWFPPPMDTDAARQESEQRQKGEAWIERQKQQRRAHVHRRDVTGRQLERARNGGPDGGSRLTAEEMDKFNTLTRRNLSGSRESICAAMAFCFEKSGAARQISEKLEELVLEDGPKIATDTRVARLYLLSDVLFNSQQPGIKNAFLYRSAIESFSPDAFASLGTHGRGSLGRLSEKKLSVAVSRVLSAWTAWSVYTPIFIDQLQDRYEGKETKPSAVEETHGRDKEEEEAIMEEEVPTIGPDDAELVSTRRKGTWQEVDEESESQTNTRAKLSVSQKEVASEWILPASRDADNGVTDGDPAYPDGETWDADGELLDADGDPLDPDGDPLDPDGDPLDADGEPLDPDGEPLEADGDPDGEALDADGDPLDPDGEPLEADGDPLDPDGDPLEADGEPLDPDGEPLDADGDSRDPDGEPLEADGEVLC